MNSMIVHFRALSLTLACFLAASCREKEESRSSGTQGPAAELEVAVLRLDPRAGDVRIEPESGALSGDETLSLTFPEDIVGRDLVGKTGLSPVVVDPPIAHDFRWVSPRRGLLILRGWNIEPVARTITLRKDLADLQGKPVEAQGWGAEFSSDDFALRSLRYLREGKEPVEPREGFLISADQHVELIFSRDVRPSEIRRRVAFMDRKTHEKFPVRVALDQHQPDAPQGIVMIEPDAPLPPDRDLWLVIERMQEARHGHLMPHLRIYPAGHTREMEVAWWRGYNQPRRGKFIRLGLSKEIDPASVTLSAFRVEPEVSLANVEAEKMEIRIFGAFETGADYKINIAEGLKARDGSALALPPPLDIQIPTRRSAVILESDHIARRSKDGMLVNLSSCRTGSLQWQLARVTGEQFPAARERLKEFAEFERDDDGKPILDPRNDEVRFRRTELLIPALKLPVVASGELGASPGEDELKREIRWPAGVARPGIYLLEITGKGEDGRPCGNRCLITLNDWWMRKVTTAEGDFLHVHSMDDMSPAADATVHFHDPGGKNLSEAKTGPDGSVRISPGTGFCVVRIGSAEVVQDLFNNAEDWEEESGGTPGKQEKKVIMVTDGDVFEPGETVRYHLTAREYSASDKPIIPSAREVIVTVTSDVPGFDSSSETLKLDASGAATGSWSIPATALSGSYRIIASLDDKIWAEGNASQDVTVCDFRLPDFDVAISAPVTTGDQAEATIRSTHFHGTPHAGAKVRWTAEWIMEDWTHYSEEGEDWQWAYFTFEDNYSERASKQGTEGILTSLFKKSDDLGDLSGLAVPASAAVRGEGVLDRDGHLKIVTPCPFPAAARRHRAQVYWIVEVQGAGGESQRKSAEQHLQFGKTIIAMSTSATDGGIRVVTVPITAADKKGENFPIDVELFRREINVAKERIGDHLVRYRNTPVFTSVWKQRRESIGPLTIPCDQPGDYVVLATAVDMPGAVPVSEEIIGFDGGGESPVLDEFSAEIIPDKRQYRVGETARLQVRTPFAGWASVTLETGGVLQTLPPVKIRGEADRIQVPITAACFPNVFVRVQVTDGGSSQRRPSERMGQCELTVSDPSIGLEVKPVLLKETPFMPGEKVQGAVRVMVEGKPVTGAQVMVLAVDEALLSLGAWMPPDPLAEFYPKRNHGVSAGRSLSGGWYDARIKHLAQSQKGFIVGGGPVYEGGLAARTRENMHPRPLWETSLKTGADGNAAFAFTAPDALTSYRIFAYARSGTSAFGTGVHRVHVSKNLQVKPFLPAFVREGDTLELRYVVENNGTAAASVNSRAAAEAPARLEGSDPISATIEPGQSKLITRLVHIEPGSAGKSAVLMISADAGANHSDTVRLSLPIHAANILKTDIFSGDLAGGSQWNARTSLDRLPSNGDFACDVMLSGTPWLPKLAGLPFRSSQSPALADVAVASLCAVLAPHITAYLPGENDAEASAQAGREYQRVMDEISSSLISDGSAGWLPRWPGDTTPDDMTTAMVALSISLADKFAGETAEEGAGTVMPVPEGLESALERWRWTTLDDIMRSRSGMPPAPPFARCIALMLDATEEYGFADDNKILAAVRGMYSHRETLDFESKCLLALANHTYSNRESSKGPLPCLTPQQTEQLNQEVAREDAPLDFRPESLGTRVRAEAIRLFVLSAMGQVPAGSARKELQRLMKPIRDSSHDLNSHENLWLLLAAFGAMELDEPAKLGEMTGGFAKPQGVASPNGITLGWLGHPLAEQRKRFDKPVSVPMDVTWMVRATHRSPVVKSEGGETLELAREMANLTAPARNGSEGSPFQLGDYVLLSYVVKGNQSLHQLRIEETLPAALELINPDLPSVRAAFTIPTEEEGNQAKLAYADRRGDSMALYFDVLSPGTNRYSVLTRVVGSGTFAWPAAQAAPLYDKRFRATTVDGTVWSKGQP